MSETLRDLVVSLSLQTDNFTRNIKSVNKQIAEAESKFRLAAAGVEDFERTTTGLSTQALMVQRRLALPTAGRTAPGAPHPPVGLRPAPGGCEVRTGGAQGSGCRRGAAGAHLLRNAGRKRLRNDIRQS